MPTSTTKQEKATRKAKATPRANAAALVRKKAVLAKQGKLDQLIERAQRDINAGRVLHLDD